MPKTYRVILIVIALVVVAGFSYLLFMDRSEETDILQSSNQQIDNPPDPAAAEPVTTEPAENGKYIDYSAQAVADSKDRRILFFHAPWCPQCRQLESSIKSGAIPSGVTIFKVDYDTNQKLRQEYGVTIQTTLVLLDDNGLELKKYVAYEKPNLDSVVEQLL